MDTNSSWDNLSLLMAAFIGAIAAGSLQFMIEAWKNKQLKKADQIKVHSDLLGCKQAKLEYLYAYFLSNISASWSIPFARLLAIKGTNFLPATKLLFVY